MSLCQQLPLGYEEKDTNCRKIHSNKRSREFRWIRNMHVPMMFDLPLSRTLHEEGESSVTLKTTGQEGRHSICVLSSTNVIVKRMTMPKEKPPIGNCWKKGGNWKKNIEMRKDVQDHLPLRLFRPDVSYVLCRFFCAVNLRQT